MEDIKGAFKNYPEAQRPERIPLVVVPHLEIRLCELFGKLGELHFPDSLKKCKKETTGDLDVLFVPQTKNWRKAIKECYLTVAHQGNSAQLMTVMENLIGDGKRYMIDFLVVKKGGLAFKKLFYSYGTTFSALLGSFARSIGYKFTDYALYKRIKDKRGQWHNYKLTSHPELALQILCLDPSFIKDDAIYTPEGVAAWIVSSERFNSDMWRYGNPDKIAVGIPINRNARDAIKKKEEVSDAYELMNLVTKTEMNCAPRAYEERVLGPAFVRKMEADINKVVINSDIILSGTEIMNLFHIPPGPEIGNIQRYLSAHFKDITSPEERSRPEFKERAKTYLLKTYTPKSII